MREGLHPPRAAVKAGNGVFVPFIVVDPCVGRVICSTNAIENVNARIRRGVEAVRFCARRRSDGKHQPTQHNLLASPNDANMIPPLPVDR